MEDNKYYIPTINEFHVGFEYEYKSKSGRWDKFTLDSDDTIADRDGFHDDWNPFSNYNLSKDNFRVKYLDKEDIQSEDFNLVEERETQWVFRKNVNYQKRGMETVAELIYNTHSNWLLITIGEEGVLSRDYDPIFSGRVKNLSKFREVLKMIEV